MAVYMINCICQMQLAIALYEFTDDQQEMLQAQVKLISLKMWKNESCFNFYAPRRGKHIVAALSVRPSRYLVWQINLKLVLPFKSNLVYR